jgi:hypothetical protein
MSAIGFTTHSALKIYNTTSSLVRFENKIFSFTMKNVLADVLQRWRCRCKFKSRRIGSRISLCARAMTFSCSFRRTNTSDARSREKNFWPKGRGKFLHFVLHKVACLRITILLNEIRGQFFKEVLGARGDERILWLSYLRPVFKAKLAPTQGLGTNWAGRHRCICANFALKNWPRVAQPKNALVTTTPNLETVANIWSRAQHLSVCVHSLQNIWAHACCFTSTILQALFAQPQRKSLLLFYTQIAQNFVRKGNTYFSGCDKIFVLDGTRYIKPMFWNLYFAVIEFCP